MDNHKKHSLGRRAFLLFFFRRIKTFILFTLFVLAAWYAERWVPSAYDFWFSYGVLVLFILDLTFLILILFRTFMEYRYYTYMFTEDAFIMTRGYVIREEVATLYHQIQNVNIRRGPLDRMIGVSQIVILMNGADRTRREGHLILPAVSKHKASQVQKELLNRARRQHMSPFIASEETRRAE